MRQHPRSCVAGQGEFEIDHAALAGCDGRAVTVVAAGHGEAFRQCIAVERRDRLAVTGIAHFHPQWRERFARERSEEHTSELQSLMRISYAVFCLKKKKPVIITTQIL